jgi:hypothetical protein
MELLISSLDYQQLLITHNYSLRWWRYYLLLLLLLTTWPEPRPKCTQYVSGCSTAASLAAAAGSRFGLLKCRWRCRSRSCSWSP